MQVFFFFWSCLPVFPSTQLLPCYPTPSMLPNSFHVTSLPILSRLFLPAILFSQLISTTRIFVSSSFSRHQNQRFFPKKTKEISYLEFFINYCSIYIL